MLSEGHSMGTKEDRFTSAVVQAERKDVIREKNAEGAKREDARMHGLGRCGGQLGWWVGREVVRADGGARCVNWGPGLHMGERFGPRVWHCGDI